jgi:hypothetical protein
VSGQAVRLALLIALLGLLQTGIPPGPTVLACLVVAAMLVASARWRIDRLALLLLLVIGLGLRTLPPAGSSDVLLVTEAAAREMLSGGNPYGHGFIESVPPGAPFAYGPLALLWYLPSLHDPGVMESIAASVVLLLLTIRGGTLGLAVYAVTPALVVASTDGANDTSAGLMILVALLVAARSPAWGAVLLALATAFKPYALAWLPGLIGYGGLAPLLAFGLISVFAWLIPVLNWGADALLWSFRRADDLHAAPYYSLAYALEDHVSLPKPAWQGLRVVAGVLAAVASLLLARSVAGLIVGGAVVFGATLFLGWWGTFAYLAAVAPILCWHLDEWFGLGSQRVAWPGDPVAVMTRRIDVLWPVRHPDRIVTNPSPPAG